MIEEFLHSIQKFKRFCSKKSFQNLEFKIYLVEYIYPEKIQFILFYQIYFKQSDSDKCI